jgi:hypothetical protein
MPKTSKSTDLTEEEKELKQWEDYCSQQGFEGDSHPYAETLNVMRKAAHDSRIKTPIDSEGL